MCHLFNNWYSTQSVYCAHKDGPIWWFNGLLMSPVLGSRSNLILVVLSPTIALSFSKSLSNRINRSPINWNCENFYYTWKRKWMRGNQQRTLQLCILNVVYLISIKHTVISIAFRTTLSMGKYTQNMCHQLVTIELAWRIYGCLLFPIFVRLL